MSEVVTKGYIGVGRVWVRAYGSTGARRHVGNVSSLTLRHNIEAQRMPEYTRPGGGTAVKLERIDTVESSMTWLNFSPENWAIATAGTVTDVALSASTVENVTGHKGSVTTLAKLPSTITTVTSDPAGTTFQTPRDYEKSAAGIYIPTTSTITDGQALIVTYANIAQKRVEGSMGTSTVLEVLFEGLNDADTQKPVVVDIWRMSVPPAAELSLIGLEFGEMAIAAELLADTSKGSSVSAFYRARMIP
jgi:hypothetical protein